MEEPTEEEKEDYERQEDMIIEEEIKQNEQR